MRLKASSSRGLVDELQVGGDVLDVGLFEEADAAGDAERNVAAGEFELQFERVEMRAIKHGHLIEVAAFLAEFQHALRNEGGLLAAVRQATRRAWGRTCGRG